MSTEPTPDEIRRATFRVVFRGYDQAEVEGRLDSLAAQVEDLIVQRDRLAARLGEFADRDLKTEFESVGREVASVLEAARSAAETMRDRASAEATRWRSEAMAEVESLRKQARTDAESLRTDAWTTGTQLLEQVMAEVARARGSAERDSLSVMGEAEREAHRLTASARREAEEVVRTAKMESERLVTQARSEHDEIIATAHRQAEAAQERARALEQRRSELMSELESVRSALSSVEGELEGKRRGIGLSDIAELPRQAVVADESGTHLESWEEGHTVRVIRPSPPDEDSEGDTNEGRADADEMAEEVARLRRQAETEDTPRDGDEVADAADDVEEPSRHADDLSSVRIIPPEPAERVEESTEVPTDAADEEPEEEPVAEAPLPAPVPEQEVADQAEDRDEATVELGPADAAPAEGDSDDVTDLFRRLRRPGDEGVPDEAPDEGADDDGPAVTKETTETVAETVAPAPVASGGPPDDAFAIRDRLLLPVTNDALRAVKRALTEAQNEALEQIRISAGDWLPDTGAYDEALGGEYSNLTEQAAGAGLEAAAELGFVPDAEYQPEVDVDQPGGDLATAVGTALEGATGGPRERSAAASRVFRGWRTDEAERRVRMLAHRSYHQALRWAVERGGGDWAWTPAGRLCPVCREAAAEGVEVPPAHRDCNCTIVPA